MARAFITGISGQDGGYLADRLVAEGTEVHGLVRGEDPARHELAARHPSITLHEGDLADHAGLARLVASIRPHEIYNLAGMTSVAQSWEQPALTGLVTGVAVASLLEAALALGDEVRVFQASSAEIFGTPTESPQTESTPLAPASPYGVAKVYAHQVCRLFRGRGAFVATGILYNHESPRRPETFVTRKITRAAARIALGLQSELRLGDVSAARDWGWAPDYVDAMIRIIRHDTPGEFVVATGVSHTVAEFAEAAFRAAGLDDPSRYITIDESFVRPAEIAEMRGDATRARTELGWAPTVDFDELVARMVETDLAEARAEAGRSG